MLWQENKETFVVEFYESTDAVFAIEIINITDDTEPVTYVITTEELAIEQEGLESDQPHMEPLFELPDLTDTADLTDLPNLMVSEPNTQESEDTEESEDISTSEIDWNK